jgi:hypothetical protein
VGLRSWFFSLTATKLIKYHYGPITTIQLFRHTFKGLKLFSHAFAINAGFATSRSPAIGGAIRVARGCATSTLNKASIQKREKSPQKRF